MHALVQGYHYFKQFMEEIFSLPIQNFRSDESRMLISKVERVRGRLHWRSRGSCLGNAARWLDEQHLSSYCPLTDEVKGPLYSNHSLSRHRQSPTRADPSEICFDISFKLVCFCDNICVFISMPPR